MRPPLKRRLLAALISVQAANTAFDVVALYPVAQTTAWGAWAKQWAKDDLDRLAFPEAMSFVFPIVKGSSVIGLLAGLRWTRLGRLTAAAVIAYFIAALAFHVRAKDPAEKYLPALGMLGWSYAVLRSLETNPAIPAGG